MLGSSPTRLGGRQLDNEHVFMVQCQSLAESDIQVDEL